MKRAVIIGNSGGGKSTLARKWGATWQCSPVEIDGLMWQPGWKLTPIEVYNAEHARLIGDESWIIDGLGRLDSIAARLARATDIVLVDMPLWVHFWLAAERQNRVDSAFNRKSTGGTGRDAVDGSAVPDHLGGRPELDAGNPSAGCAGGAAGKAGVPAPLCR
jgi:hypothetical protein